MKIDLTEMEKRYKDLAFQKYLLYTMINTESKTGRNNLCFCNSGKKFKKCCLSQHIEKKEKLNNLIIDLNDLQTEYTKLEKENLKLENKNGTI